MAAPGAFNVGSMICERREPGIPKTQPRAERAAEVEAATSGEEALERGRRRMGLLFILAGAALMGLAFLDVAALI